MKDPGIVDRRPKERGGEHGIEQIVVALDPSAHSMAALEAAVRMAGRLGADLQAIFIEDVNIRRLTELPFVQEVGLYTGSCRRVEVQELSRQLRGQAGRMRRRFWVMTRHIETRCTFREIRGRVASEVLSAAAEADVVIVGKGAWSPFDTERLAPPVREVLGEAPASSLVLRAGVQVEPPMRVVYDGTPLADKALATAAELAQDHNGQGMASIPVMVFGLADDPEKASQLEERVRERLGETELEVSFQTLTEASVSRLAYLVAHEERGTLLLPAGTGTLEDEAVLDFLDETNAPVLLIR
jgi:nucleotide-binding universal stress UspA family protein